MNLSQIDETRWNQVLVELDCDLMRLICGRLVNRSLLNQSEIPVLFYVGEYGSGLRLFSGNADYYLQIDTVEIAGSVEPADRVYLISDTDTTVSRDRVYWEWQSDLSDQDNLETLERHLNLFLVAIGYQTVQGCG